ncbi:MAG: AAA family ATPase [Panacagrimonas sp.]
MRQADQKRLLDCLRRLKLERYAGTLVDQGIDLQRLARLNPAQLASLGVPSRHCQTLLQAARKSGPTPSAERRQITVVFCDMVKSTDLSSRLDLDDLYDVMKAYERVCTEVMLAHGGFVARYLGDGLLVYFGYPTTSEDAPERAVRAGLEVCAAVERIVAPDGARLEVRVGAATGMVVVGDIVGELGEVGITGQVPNLAARVLSVTPPGQVAIADSTRRLIGSRFELEDLGDHALRGIAGETRLWRVLHERAVATRFEAMRTPGLPLFGREAELAALNERWYRALDGHGQVVVLYGDAGIGKSTVLRHFEQGLLESGASRSRVHLQCTERHANTPMHPLVVNLRRSAGIEPDDPAELKLAKIAEILPVAGSAQSVPLVARLLSVPMEPRPPVLQLPAARQKALTLELMAERIVALSADRPMLLIVEDAHWIDPSSAELAERLVDLFAQRRVLVIIAARPEYKPPWLDRPHVASLSLEPLCTPLIRRVIESTAGVGALPEGLVDQIATRAGGVPLFAEELTKAVIESASQATAGAWSGPAPSLKDVPSTLQDGLMSRLDRLGPGKELAQAGAAIGNRFSVDLLAAATGLDRSRAIGTLRSLVDAGMLAPDPETGDYLWCHALVQDAAYDSLLRPGRKSLHASIARAMETTMPHLAETEPETLAHHWGLTAQEGRAVPYGLKAGQIALSRSANVEAIRHLSKAASLLPQVEEERQRRTYDFGLHLAMGQACYVVRGPAATETAAAYSRAQTLVDHFDDIEQRCTVLYGIFSSYHFAARFDLAAEPAARVLELARQHENPEHLCQAHRMAGYMHFFKGECREARQQFTELVRHYRPEKHRPLAARYGADCRVASLAFQTLILGVSGEVELALRTASENIAHARELGHPASQGWLYASLGYLHFWLRQPLEALAITEEGVRFCQEHHIGSWELHCRAFNAWARCTRSDAAACAEELHQIMNAVPAGTLLGLPLLRALLAEVLLTAVRPGEALAQALQGIEEMTATGQNFFAPSLHQVRAQCLLQLSVIQDDELLRGQAIAAFGEAVHAAGRMGAHLLGLRAALDLLALAKDAETHARELKRVMQLAACCGDQVPLPELVRARQWMGPAPGLVVALSS